MSDRKALLQQKLRANGRRLKRPVLIEALASHGISASAVGDDRQNAIADKLRTTFKHGEWRDVSKNDLASELRGLGAGDTLFVFPDLEDEPGLVMSRASVVHAVATDTVIFSIDGFLVVDADVSAAVGVDLDEHGSLQVKHSWRINDA